MHEFKIISEYLSKLSKKFRGALNLNDDVFFDKTNNLVVSIDTYNEGNHFLNFKNPVFLTNFQQICPIAVIKCSIKENRSIG